MTRGRSKNLRAGLVKLLSEKRLCAWQMAEELGYHPKSVQCELRSMRTLGLPCLQNLLDGRAVKRPPGQPRPVPDNVRMSAEEREPKKTGDEVVAKALLTRHHLDGWLR